MNIGAKQAGAEWDDYVEQVLSEAPPLTEEQRHRLAELLRPVRISGGAG
nr:hypothetical protein [Mycobacterium malmoense]